MPAGPRGSASWLPTFDTYFARAIGRTFTTSTGASAVTGALTTLCLPGTGCGLFPITVPFVTSNCDNNGTLTPGSATGRSLARMTRTPTTKPSFRSARTRTTISVADPRARSAGLTFRPRSGRRRTALPQQIQGRHIDPLHHLAAVPDLGADLHRWRRQGRPCDPGRSQCLPRRHCADPAVRRHMQVKPAGDGSFGLPAGEIGVGANTWYHIPCFASFKIDLFYIDGNDRKQCDNPPGAPFVSGNGANGCFKGWWVCAARPRRHRPRPVTPSTSNQLGVQLIK